MKKISTILSALVLAAIVLVSCHKDNLKATLLNLNTLKVTTDLTNADPTVFITADSIVIKQNDSLKVRVKIAQSVGSASNFSYVWMITQSAAANANPAQYIVGTSAQLATKVILPPNLYRLAVKVTDNSTGVSYFKFFQLNVFSSAWGNEGWLVLQDQPSKGGDDIGVITTNDGSAHGQVYNNVYSLMNVHKLPLGSYKINVIDYATSLRTQKVSVFYPNGGIQLRSYDFADSVAYQNWSIQPPTTTNLQVNWAESGYGIGVEYVINNNQISFRAVNATSIKTPPVNFGAPFLGSFTLAPFIIASGSLSDNYAMLYDKANYCFLGINASTSVFAPANADVPNKHFATYTGSAATLDPNTGSGFDLNNMTYNGQGYNLIYAENAQPLNTSSCYWNTFFRNNANTSTYLVQFAKPNTNAFSNNFTTGRYSLTNANCPGINLATKFACNTSLPMPNGVFYYVNGSNIYTCKVKALATSTASVGLSFAAGTIIKVMKVYNSGYTTLPTTEGKVLVVATDETASGKGNNVYFFNLNPTTGDILGTPSAPADFYTGFDTINDIAFKKALGK